MAILKMELYKIVNLLLNLADQKKYFLQIEKVS